MIGLAEDSERQPLLNVVEAVVPLQFAYVWTCAKTWTKTHERDPLMRYLQESQVQKPSSTLVSISDTLTMAAMLALLMAHNVALAVHKGEGFIVVNPPESGRTSNILDRIRRRLVSGLKMALNRDLCFLVESRKRNEETDKKVEDAVKFALGDRVKQMFYISILVTDMDTDIHNHAGGLLDAVTGLADLVNQGVWIKSTSTAQVAFLRSHGFTSMVEVALGDQNPKWHESPIIVDIVSKS